MQFGICGSPETAVLAAEFGYDYVESSVGALLQPRESGEAFARARQAHDEAPLPFPAVNCFLPGDLKVTGPDVDLDAVAVFARTAFARARVAGVEIVVFGSGGARRIPEGFERETAWGQLVDCCRTIAPLAAAEGVIVAMEPLNKSECNVLTSVSETAELVRATDHPGVRLLVDAYHLLKDDDDIEAIVRNGELLVHVHIATENARMAPGAEECDFFPFFDALKRAGYDGRISIEGQAKDPRTDLPRALELMRRLAH